LALLDPDPYFVKVLDPDSEPYIEYTDHNTDHEVLKSSYRLKHGDHFTEQAGIRAEWQLFDMMVQMVLYQGL